MINELDVLSLFADQLPELERAKLVSALAIDKMAQSIGTRQNICVSLKTPFTNEPLTILTDERDRDGTPTWYSAFIHGEGDDMRVIMFWWLSENGVETHLNDADRDQFPGFVAFIFAALDEILAEAEEKAKAAAVA